MKLDNIGGWNRNRGVGVGIGAGVGVGTANRTGVRALILTNPKVFGAMLANFRPL